MTQSDGITIRCVSPDNAVAVAALSAELGYPVAIETIRKRLAQFANVDDHAIFGAYLQRSLDGESLAGWIDIGIVDHLVSGRYGEIGGLIVGAAHQGCGIGKDLVKAAEGWVLARGVGTILVRSQTMREGAHAFYLKQNFARVKTSAVFQKKLRDMAE